MTATILILEFLLFSFIGGILDLLYNFVTERKWSNTGYFKAPFCPIYGVGALILIFVFKMFAFLSPFYVIMVGSVAMIVLEYVGGIFTERILKLKLWDYSASRFHLHGYIHPLHSFYWLVLTIVFYFVLYPLVILFESALAVPDYLEFPILALFMISALWLTIRKMPAQFFEIRGKMMNLTLERYKDVYSMICKYKKSSFSSRKKLQRLIQQQLKNTNATLKKMPLKWK
ncbi:MAG TPA: putative ABC transporter permease [Candidatus Nanoarchaeia archaeon]|nr:putative ABC transporter permease [Candidatus Nanoarchaeia archaeon]